VCLYLQVDPRVRPLVYIVKHWAKARHINSPADGTLSSYGYIICLLHFLQVGR
jgi:terminal uridylyltransferase